MTKAPGVHSVTFGPSGEYYLDIWSSLSDPTRTAVHTADGAEWSVYREPDTKPAEEYELLRPEIVPVKAADGTTLYARLIKPAGFQPERKYPAIVFVYGGPGPQTVRNQWSGLTFEQAMAHSGFVIWQLDNRGSSGRGHAWESKLYRRMGKQELEDQKRGVEHLISLGFVDPTRVGIHGSSYGGFMTLTALLHAPDTFRAGVAGAPVTDWRLYDTIYTERYLGLPSENEEGYKASSPLHFANKLSRPLMLMHNLEDDNVLLQHTVRMADALQNAGKQFELMVYPQKTHAVTGVARKHQLTAIASFFERHLKTQGAVP
jgi:dipeptidyl-peptidase-4